MIILSGIAQIVVIGDHDTLNVARRTCGYIGSNFWNKGRTQEIKERVLHIDNKDDE